MSLFWIVSVFSTQIGELLRSSFFGPVELNAVCVGHVIGFLGLMEDNHSCQWFNICGKNIASCPFYTTTWIINCTFSTSQPTLFGIEHKQPPLISDQRPISQSHLAQNKYIHPSMSDQRPHLLKIWYYTTSTVSNFVWGQKVFTKCSLKIWCFYLIWKVQEIISKDSKCY